MGHGALRGRQPHLAPRDLHAKGGYTGGLKNVPQPGHWGAMGARAVRKPEKVVAMWCMAPSPLGLYARLPMSQNTTDPTAGPMSMMQNTPPPESQAMGMEPIGMRPMYASSAHLRSLVLCEVSQPKNSWTSVSLPPGRSGTAIRHASEGRPPLESRKNALYSGGNGPGTAFSRALNWASVSFVGSGKDGPPIPEILGRP